MSTITDASLQLSNENPDKMFLHRIEHDVRAANTFFKYIKNDWNQSMLAKYPHITQFHPQEKHCSWCYNALKNRKVYMSHWLKDTKGCITCPKLLKTVCRNCGNLGHMMGKFCPEPQKPRNQLLPSKPRKNYTSREDEEYETGDSDYFELSSDEEDK